MVDLLANPWVNLVAILVLSLLVTKIITFVLIKLLQKLTSLTKSTKDDELLKKVENPIIYLVGLLLLQYFIPGVGLDSGASATFSNIVSTCTILVIARILSVIVALVVTIWEESFSEKHNQLLNPQLASLFTRSTSIIVYSIALVYVLTVWNIEILPILGSLGIAGIAIAFALQETLKNFFGGIQLILDRNIAKGDIVELSNGTSGMIRDISLRSTRLRTWDNRLVIVPNGILANEVVTNITQPDKSRRVTVLFGVAYGTDPDYVKHIVIEEIAKIENVEQIDPAPRVLFRLMGASSLDFEALYWVKDLANFVQAREDGTTRIYERLNKEGISIPFPQTTVWFNDESKVTAKKYVKKNIPVLKAVKTKSTSAKKTTKTVSPKKSSAKKSN